MSNSDGYHPFTNRNLYKPINHAYKEDLIPPGKDPVKCSFKGCDKICNNAEHLWKHMAYHTGIFKCYACGETFYERGMLTKHHMAHLNAQ